MNQRAPRNDVALPQHQIGRGSRLLATASDVDDAKFRVLLAKPGSGLADLGRIAAPTLLLWGASDRLVPPIYGEAFLKRIQRARLTLFTGASHMLPFEKDHEFVEVVTDFLLVQ